MLSNRNLTILTVQKKSKEAFNRFYLKVKYLQFSITKVELNLYLDIIAYLNIAIYLNIVIHLDIAKHSKITNYISKNIKLKNSNRSRKI